MTEAPDIFSTEHHVRGWGTDPGPGAAPEVTVEYRAFLERFVRMNEVHSIVDLGGRDWSLTRAFDVDGQVAYRRFDVIGGLPAAEGVSAELMPDRIADLPGGDLLIAKDLLQHLQDRDIVEILDLAARRFRFALFTNSYEKEGAHRNGDIPPGQFRPLDLLAPPYRARGAYVLETWGRWERLRTLLITGAGTGGPG